MKLVKQSNLTLGQQNTDKYVRDLDSDVHNIVLATRTKLDLKTLQVGDDTNNVYIDSTGNMSFEGSATVWDDLRVEPTIRGTGANNPTFSQWFTTGAGSRGVFLFDFTDELTANQKEVFFSAQLPHSWKGTAIYPHVHFIPSKAENSARPVFGLEYNWADIGSNFGNTLIVYTTSLTPSDTNLVQYRHYISSFSPITPTTSQDGISSCMICRLFRFSGDASDTFTGTCGMIYIDIHFEIDTIGSKTELSK